MATATADDSVPSTPEVGRVDPRAPRFGQTLTTLGLAAGILLAEPLLVYGVTAVLVTSVLTGWRVDAWGLLWKHVGRRFVDSADPEPAAPHRFAKLMGATFTLGASALLLGGFPLLGLGVAAMVAALAGIAAGADICVGCRLYRQVSFFRRLGVV